MAIHASHELGTLGNLYFISSFCTRSVLAQVKESFRWRFILSESGGADEMGLLIPRDTNALRLHPHPLLTFTGTPVLVSGFKETSEFHGNSLRKEWMKDASQWWSSQSSSSCSWSLQMMKRISNKFKTFYDLWEKQISKAHGILSSGID